MELTYIRYSEAYQAEAFTRSPESSAERVYNPRCMWQEIKVEACINSHSIPQRSNGFNTPYRDVSEILVTKQDTLTPFRFRLFASSGLGLRLALPECPRIPINTPSSFTGASSRSI